MKPLWLLLVGVVVGWAASGVDWSREAVGQDVPRSVDPGGINNPGPELKRKIAEWTKEAAEYSQINRYQISSHDSTGAYVIDSVTGKVWQVAANVRPRLIVDELPQK